jgi:hypothetical protein
MTRWIPNRGHSCLTNVLRIDYSSVGTYCRWWQTRPPRLLRGTWRTRGQWLTSPQPGCRRHLALVSAAPRTAKIGQPPQKPTLTTRLSSVRAAFRLRRVTWRRARGTADSWTGLAGRRGAAIGGRRLLALGELGGWLQAKRRRVLGRVFQTTPFPILLLLPSPLLAPRIPWFAIAFYSRSAPMSEMHPRTSSSCGLSQSRFYPGEEPITNPTSRLPS